MAAPANLETRAARDRIIDLLGIADTYPLQDVPVRSEPKVGYGQEAPFAIQPGQVNVRYELFAGGEGGSPAGAADGTGDVTLLSSSPVTEDTTFRIRAEKTTARGGVVPSAWLHGEMRVKVGVDAGRTAWIHGVPRMHPELTSPPAFDPWITGHGASVEVRIERAQAGVRYELDVAGTLTAPATGTGEDLALWTPPVLEDTVIRIRATGPPSPGGPPEGVAELLDARLPLAVRADPKLGVSLAGTGEAAAVVDPAEPVTITLAASQASAVYSAFVRRLRDGDFPRVAAPGQDVLRVAVPASPDAPAREVAVRAPPRFDPWQTPPGFALLGVPTGGSGGDQGIEIGEIRDDVVLVIQARKEHFAGGLAGDLPVLSGASELSLERPLAALPRPEAVPGLTLTVTPDSGDQSGEMLVSGGQRGVFYHFRIAAGGEEIGLPAYFHRLDEDDPGQDRGIGQLEIGLDLAISRVAPGDPGTAGGAAHPPDPLVGVAPLPGPTASVTAVKARTGVGWAAARLVPVRREGEP